MEAVDDAGRSSLDPIPGETLIVDKAVKEFAGLRALAGDLDHREAGSGDESRGSERVRQDHAPQPSVRVSPLGWVNCPRRDETR